MSTSMVVRGEISDALPEKLNGGGVRELLTMEQVMALTTPMLPKGVTYESVIASVVLEGDKNPEILQCVPRTIVQAVSRALQTGLEIGVTVFLVPFNVNVAKKGQPDRWEKHLNHVVHYTGLIQLIKESGHVRHATARVVYENDEFDMSHGTGGTFYHKPDRNPATRGKPTGAYLVLYLPFGIQEWEFIPLGDAKTEDTIEYIRQKYSKRWKNGACPAWYMKKTAVRQFTKLIPKDRRSAKLYGVAEADAVEEFGAPEVLPRLAAGDDDDIPRAPQLTSG